MLKCNQCDKKLKIEPSKFFGPSYTYVGCVDCDNGGWIQIPSYLPKEQIQKYMSTSKNINTLFSKGNKKVWK